MKNQVTLGQVIGSVVTMLVAMLTAWITLKTQVTTLEETAKSNIRRIESLERREDMMEDKREKDMAEIRDALYEIKIAVEKKKDK